jgi:hypothetical protein
VGYEEYNGRKEKCLQVKDHVEGLGIDGRIILQWI